MRKVARRVLAGVLAVAFVISGCATGAKGPSDEELISSLMTTWADALAAKNIDKILPCYSEKFQDADGRGKAQLKDFLGSAISSGYLDGVKMTLTDAKTTIEGDKATITPVTLSSNAGAISLSLSLVKEQGNWLIVASNEA